MISLSEIHCGTKVMLVGPKLTVQWIELWLC
jgi:hypothetical protein